MQNRTFLRTMLDIFFKNAIVIAIVNIWHNNYRLSKHIKEQKYENNNFLLGLKQCDVKICNEDIDFCEKNLKFLKNVPLNKVERHAVSFGKMTATHNK